MSRSDALILLSSGLEREQICFLPKAKSRERKKKFFLPLTVVNIWKSLGADWFFKKQTKTKQPFYALFRVPRGTLSRLVDVFSESGGKKYTLVYLSFSLLQTEIHFREPCGRIAKFRATIAQGQTYSSLNRKLSKDLKLSLGKKQIWMWAIWLYTWNFHLTKTKWVLLAIPMP